MQNVANISILAMFVMYLLTALFGYLTFYGKKKTLRCKVTLFVNKPTYPELMCIFHLKMRCVTRSSLGFRWCGVGAVAHLQPSGPPGCPGSPCESGCAGGRYAHCSCCPLPRKNIYCVGLVKIFTTRTALNNSFAIFCPHTVYIQYNAVYNTYAM